MHREIKKNPITANVGLRAEQTEWMGQTQGNYSVVSEGEDDLLWIDRYAAISHAQDIGAFVSTVLMIQAINAAGARLAALRRTRSLPVEQEALQGREGSALPDPFLARRIVTRMGRNRFPLAGLAGSVSLQANRAGRGHSRAR
ncbi:hypothetical protein [Bradyrhizobium sp. BWA-3-5]|uniref:hypothetical protein n=1 Tax=Bradyrhizobium sp. BWA-3-5 TaxID=3080013 RepID=UPI00293EA5AB|nr:hypothetical protein [Bradyrhizobium sp. BWA-3-5]WOH68632.1 hypothetical protein RX331_13365 [Bradyrhizobium sp. BWA-3-5]